ncbi:MAG: cob(I)alamin adenosyltransferase [Candidatus Berkelbacteria bacterium Licking1014_2]|uniref:Cob(I)alamin adenosyltransferase n=1 Tax=Candidatus Berkelbacteria bacterium Licking1014_2 TaxID=2017146 RepID=A0A554LV65_9BACT|nr:MAG: cob(I)alamin adenosyltransferase [Candidatus Berkelbacteria bacterium Licking1014_2]
MLIIFTGKGKGKTTAALGIALRSLGWQRRVAIIQFIKGYKQTGEWRFCQNNKLIDIFHTIDDKKMAIGSPTAGQRSAAKKSWIKAKEILASKKYDLIILDELNNACYYKIIDTKEVIDYLKVYTNKIDIIVTGRGAPKKLIAAADLVSEIKEIKHPFKKGGLARKGIDL